jgi:hypothetical protein
MRHRDLATQTAFNIFWTRFPVSVPSLDSGYVSHWLY